MTLVVDASVAVLWTLTQRGSDEAAELQSAGEIIAPSLIVAEIGNAIWKAVRRGDLPPRETGTALKIALGPLDALVPIEDISARALQLAVERDHPVYDCFYLALAEREQCPCVTADRRLAAAAKGLKNVEVRAL